MHHFIYPTKDTWISSGSRKTDGEPLSEQNFGKDEILELKKEFYNPSTGDGTILPSVGPSVFELKNPNENVKGVVL